MISGPHARPHREAEQLRLHTETLPQASRQTEAQRKLLILLNPLSDPDVGLCHWHRLTWLASHFSNIVMSTACLHGRSHSCFSNTVSLSACL